MNASYPKSRSLTTRTLTLLCLGLCASLSLVTGCAAKKPLVLHAVRDAATRNPLVIVPGISGSRLRDTANDEIVWGRPGNFFSPRDGGQRLILPIDPELASQDTLEPAGGVLGLRLLGVVKVDVYQQLIDTLQANGYQLGDLEAPRPDDTLFVFGYDWRKGNVETAAKFSEALNRVRAVRGEPVMHVDLICQSNAARLARYFIKYGDASLEEAETGRPNAPTDVQVDRLILVGTANGGALSALSDVHRGRRYVPLVGRRFHPEAIFTFKSMYETLPMYRDEHFFDEDGNTIDADLFNADDWKRYGWSIYAKKPARRLAKLEQKNPAFADAAARHAFLARSLDRARRLNDVLMRDVPDFGNTRYYQMQNLYVPTADRALLFQKNGDWRIAFNDQRKVRKDDYLFQLASAPGDGHATRGSHEWLSPQEKAARVGRKVSIPTAHRKIVLHPATRRLILQALAEPMP